MPGRVVSYTAPSLSVLSRTADSRYSSAYTSSPQPSWSGFNHLLLSPAISLPPTTVSDLLHSSEQNSVIRRLLTLL